MDHEGYHVAQFLADHGVAAIILKYRLAHQSGSIYTVEGMNWRTRSVRSGWCAAGRRNGASIRIASACWDSPQAASWRSWPPRASRRARPRRPISSGA